MFKFLFTEIVVKDSNEFQPSETSDQYNHYNHYSDANSINSIQQHQGIEPVVKYSGQSQPVKAELIDVERKSTPQSSSDSPSFFGEKKTLGWIDIPFEGYKDK